MAPGRSEPRTSPVDAKRYMNGRAQRQAPEASARHQPESLASVAENDQQQLAVAPPSITSGRSSSRRNGVLARLDDELRTWRLCSSDVDAPNSAAAGAQQR